MNLRVDAEGHAVREGLQTEIGGNDRYLALCRRHFTEAMTGEATMPAPFVSSGVETPSAGFSTSLQAGREDDCF